MVELFLSRLVLRRLIREASQVSEEIIQLDGLSERRLKEEILSSSAVLRRSGGFQSSKKNDVSPRALALVAIVCERSLGIKPSFRQILAAMAMRGGFVFELELGDGKSLAIAMAAVLYIWSGHPCHIVSSSEYVARRNARALQPFFELCGCGVAALSQDTPADRLAEFYGRDILYVTSRQLLSDYIRGHFSFGGVSGNLRRRLGELRTPLDSRASAHNGPLIAIIDDAGGILVEEASSPFVITVPGRSSILEEVTHTARALADELQADRDYVLDHDSSLVVRLTPEGEHRISERASELPPFWRHAKRSEDAITSAILAKDVLQRDRHYVVREQKIGIADSNIQKLLSGQSWQFGVIQALEVREGLPLTVPPRTIARTAYQQFFPRYHMLSGSGAAIGEFRRELWQTYRLRLLRSPVRTPASVINHRYEFANSGEKLDALIEDVKRLQRERLAVLIGVPRVANAFEIVERLSRAEMECSVLDGKDPESDANLLSVAQDAGRITLVTGSAVLNLDLPIDRPVQAAGPLQFLLFEHHESRRMDKLFLARARLQEASNKGVVYASIQDEVLARCLYFWAIPLRLIANWRPLRSQSTAVLIYLSQWAVRSQAAKYRALLLQREEQLDQQLSFFSKLYHDNGPRM